MNSRIGFPGEEYRLWPEPWLSRKVDLQVVESGNGLEPNIHFSLAQNNAIVANDAPVSDWPFEAKYKVAHQLIDKITVRGARFRGALTYS